MSSILAKKTFVEIAKKTSSRSLSTTRGDEDVNLPNILRYLTAGEPGKNYLFFGADHNAGELGNHQVSAISKIALGLEKLAVANPLLSHQLNTLKREFSKIVEVETGKVETRETAEIISKASESSFTGHLFKRGEVDKYLEEVKKIKLDSEINPYRTPRYGKLNINNEDFSEIARAIGANPLKGHAHEIGSTYKELAELKSKAQGNGGRAL